MADSTQALAYEEALRGVTQQQQVLDGIRARVSTLLGIAAISASFLGGVALNKDSPKGSDLDPDRSVRCRRSAYHLNPPADTRLEIQPGCKDPDQRLCRGGLTSRIA